MNKSTENAFKQVIARLQYCKRLEKTLDYVLDKYKELQAENELLQLENNSLTKQNSMLVQQNDKILNTMFNKFKSNSK